MSAAEKLKALKLRPEQLQPALTSLAWEDYEQIRAYCNALPQIVAVVEAAELGRHYTKAMHSWYWDKGDVVTADTIHGSLDRIDAALAALDEQLGDLGSPPTSERSTAL